jgi:threonine dehydrogenase-like Zn-dependent dehydrogenase
MLAAVLEGVGKMVLKEMEKPKTGFGEVVVKVMACGICQTDYSAYTGRRTNFTPGVIVGHEISGVVDEIGEGVTTVKPQDEVVILPAVQCGHCKYCRTGFDNYCPNGLAIGGEGYDNVLNGGFAEYVLVPEKTLYEKPKNVSFPAAALTEPLAGSYKGLIEFTQLRIGEDVVIIGAGGMGLLLTQIAAAAGAGNLIVIDIEDFKQEYALRCGAKHFINARKEDAKKRVYEILEDGPDIVFEAAGALEAAKLTFDLTRRGTRINMFGVIIPGEIPVSPAKIHFQETRMDASFSVTPRVMIKALELLKKELVDPMKMITHQIPLKEIDKALEVMGSPNRVKVVVIPSEK